MDQNNIIKFLDSFFKIFNARIDKIDIDEKVVKGKIIWNDENAKQEFMWIIDFDDLALIEMKLLVEFLFANNLIHGDKIIISETDLIAKIIKEKIYPKNVELSINNLCDLEIKMIDDGEESDSFFLHF
jgi:hypothetical protein